MLLSKERNVGTSLTLNKLSEYPHVFKAHKYCDDVLSGRIDVCNYVKLACKRHLSDIKRSREEDHLYYFDPAAGEHICAFGECFTHTKGKWDNQQIILEPWQCFILVVIFGWKRKSDHYRRFREVYEEVARKNGKSIIVAIVGLYMLTADGEQGAEVYCGATSKDQAYLVFEPAKLMAAREPDFLMHYDVDVFTSRIVVKDSNAKFLPVIAKPKDGTSPHCAILDEYHEHPTNALKSSFETGFGARTQPLLYQITTAGEDISKPCYHTSLYAKQVLEGNIIDDRMFAIIYTIDDSDDWTDFNVWKKANPNYGVSVLEENLRADYERALNLPQEQNSKKAKHLNVWSGAAASWLNMAKWKKNKTELCLEHFKGRDIYIGFDLASKVDLAAVSVFIPDDGTGKSYAFGMYYLPRETVDKKENEHFRIYEKLGLLTVTDGARTNFEVIEQDILRLNEDYNVIAIGYDPKEANNLVNNLLEKIGNKLVEVTQNASNMNSPMKEFEALVEDGCLLTSIHDICLDWQAGNVIRKENNVKYYYPAKSHEKNKIDGIVALLMAVLMYMANRTYEPATSVVAW